MARCLIGCGSNQGRRRENINQAVDLLRFMPGVTVLAESRPLETRPVGGPPGQPAFLNSACLLETDLPPQAVLEMLLAVENTLQRERDERWGPRTIDLDLLLYDDAVIDSERLTLPHPRMATRRFVLQPCAEIAGTTLHPRAGCTVRELLDNLSQDHPHVAIVGAPGAGAPEVAAAVSDAMLARLLRNPAPLAKHLFAPRADAGAAAPGDAQLEAAWLESLAARAKPLEAASWPRDPHGTVSDYWLETQRLAAAEILPPASLARFETAFARHAAATVAPNVVILLLAAPDVLEERFAFRMRRPPPQTDLFADVEPGSTTLCQAPPESVARLVGLQERLARRLRGPSGNGVPKATVVIDSGDLGQATLEAIAAVEAMA
jgi:2-amino-4-hydroxy-6-hydroxymethyldihydropteridine diphosphokinase